MQLGKHSVNRERCKAQIIAIYGRLWYFPASRGFECKLYCNILKLYLH